MLHQLNNFPVVYKGMQLKFGFCHDRKQQQLETFLTNFVVQDGSVHGSFYLAQKIMIT